jgi:3-hydroxyisobutyrate dehydrogenase
MVVRTIGFIGIGLMGQPMAVNLARSGLPLKVWNRTPEKLDPVIAAGAIAVRDVEEIFASCEAIFLMLSTSEAVDTVLGRGTSRFGERVAGKLIINTATMRPEHSVALAAEIRSAGGGYVEAPVSGSRQQAQERRLVAMLAGEPEAVARARTLLAHTCKECFDCGPLPGALKMKLAVNLFMLVMVTGLVEAFHFAERAGIDVATLREILAASPMASNVSQVKAQKLATRDWSPQAALADVFKNTELVGEATVAAGAAAPLLRTCGELYARALELKLGAFDMVAVSAALDRLAAASAQEAD